MASMSVPIGSRVDVNLKRAFDETAEELGLTPTSALTVLMKRFVDEGGFPFAVRKRVPTQAEFADEMDARYRAMVEGGETAHDLVEA